MYNLLRARSLGCLYIWAFWPVCVFLSLVTEAGGELSDHLQIVRIPESHSGNTQPSRIWIPPVIMPGSESDKARPLIVVLHTWSGNFMQNKFSGGEKDGIIEVLEACSSLGWMMVMPDFRGPNTRPEACGSPMAVRDVLDAIHYMKSRYPVDSSAVFLVGVSGGGHMALLTAAQFPEVFAGVSSWVPISDVAAWHRECRASGRAYADHLEKVCGGPPGASEAVDTEYRMRSPLTFLQNAGIRNVPLDINAGIHDGHSGSVPISHSLNAFNRITQYHHDSAGLIPDEVIDLMVREARVPDSLSFAGLDGVGQEIAESRRNRILFRREAGRARVTLFDGGHEGEIPAAFHFFSAIYSRNRD